MGLIRVIRDTFLDFGRNTSIAGLNNAAKAKSIIRSLIWLSLFTVGLYYTLVGIISVINDYNNFPVVTKTQLQQEKLVNFPAISICNHNRVHCTNLLTQYYDMKEAIDNGTINDQEFNATVFILDALFDKTGCRIQVCDQVIDSLSFNRSQEGNFSKSDWSLVKLAQITCDLRDSEEDRAKVCYHLAFAKEDKEKNREYDGPIVARVDKAKKSFECDKVDVCEYGKKETPGPELKDQQQQQQPQIRSPDSCQEKSAVFNNKEQQPGSDPNPQENQNGQPDTTQTGGTANTSTINGTQGGGSTNTTTTNGTQQGGTTDPGATNGTQGGSTNTTTSGTQAGSNDLTTNGTQTGTSNGTTNGTQAGSSNSTTNETQFGGAVGPSSNGGQSGPGNRGGTRKKRAPPSRKISPTEFDQLGGDIDIYAEFLIDYLNVSKEVRLSIGHQLNTKQSLFEQDVPGFIQDCTYRGKSCSDAKFWYPQDTPGYGNCYTFNGAFAQIDSEAPRKASLTGITNGFSIQLYLDQGNYMLKKLSKKAGARLIIHDTMSPPLPDEYGIDLQPNTASSIAIQKNDVERKPTPYESNCSYSWNNTGYEIETNMTYTLAACQRFCLQKDLIADCKCFHPDLYQAAIPLHENVKTCNVLPVSNNTDYVCFEKVFEDYNTLKRNCTCNVACKETEFLSTVSVSKWPSNQYFVQFGLSLKDFTFSQSDLKGIGPDSAEVQSELQQNFVQADIYYQTLNVRSIVQEAKYSEDGYVAALGGALSVYMGIAVIMIFELLELGIDLFLNVWKFYNGGQKEKQ